MNIKPNNIKQNNHSNILELLSDSDSDQDIPRLNYNTENGQEDLFDDGKKSEIPELANYIYFHKEQKIDNLKKDALSKKSIQKQIEIRSYLYFGIDPQQIRYFLLFMISIPYVTAFIFWDFHYFLVPFTNWTLIFTTIQLTLCVFGRLSYQLYGKNSLNKQRLLDRNKYSQYLLAFTLQQFHHLIFTIALVSNAVVMTVYWSLLHKGQMDEYKNQNLWGKRFHLRIVHSIPGFVCFLNMIISPIRLKMEFWKITFLICMVYSFFLYIVFLKKGIIQYWFTDFRQGYKAWINLFLINLGASSFYIGLVRCERYFKGEIIDFQNFEKHNKNDESSIMMKQFDVSEKQSLLQNDEE